MLKGQSLVKRFILENSRLQELLGFMTSLVKLAKQRVLLPFLFKIIQAKIKPKVSNGLALLIPPVIKIG